MLCNLPILPLRGFMPEERTSGLTFSIAGLFAGVGVAWVLLLLGGSFGTDWILAGFLAFGLGVLSLNAIDRLGQRISAARVESPGKEPLIENVAESSDDEEPAPAPRLKVMLISSGLEALAAALLTLHFLGDVLVSLLLGLALGVVAVIVSLAVSRSLTQAT
jgi:hypothetical protein